MILEQKDLAIEVEKLRASKRKIVFTNGCFDIIHPGHISYLEESKKLGDILIVALNTDASVRRLKGETRPINNEDDRAIVMNALKPVDYVTFFDQDTPYEIISLLKPDIITKGGDYIAENVVGYDILNKYGGRVVIINFVENKSTTSIINKMKKYE